MRWTGWCRDIFQHAADEVAHVDEGRVLGPVELRDRRLGASTPVAPAIWVRPVARATSMPR